VGLVFGASWVGFLEPLVVMAAARRAGHDVERMLPFHT
jgi:hypothetical protein